MTTHHLDDTQPHALCHLGLHFSVAESSARDLEAFCENSFEKLRGQVAHPLPALPAVPYIGALCCHLSTHL